LLAREVPLRPPGVLLDLLSKVSLVFVFQVFTFTSRKGGKAVAGELEDLSDHLISPIVRIFGLDPDSLNVVGAAVKSSRIEACRHRQYLI
jgi:hypothetical protein